MMIMLEMTQTVLGIIATVTVIIAAIAGVIVFWRKGGNAASAEANNALLQVAAANKLQMEQMQKDIIGLQERERAQLGEIGMLKGELKAKDAQIAILQSVDISKNPAFLKFMTYMTEVSQRADAFMQKSDGREDKILFALQEVATFMEKINSHFDTTHPISPTA